MEAPEAIQVAISKLDGNLREAEKNSLMLQGMIAGLQKMRTELVTLLVAAEADQKKKE